MKLGEEIHRYCSTFWIVLLSPFY
uniref:Uncharacterized protein n=1 Tax=Rhizophora mucronata TaxID=61149 RepID=A0A2P2MZ78_RHIMU